MNDLYLAIRLLPLAVLLAACGGNVEPTIELGRSLAPPAEAPTETPQGPDSGPADRQETGTPADAQAVTRCAPVPWCDASSECTEPGAVCTPFRDASACEVPTVPYCWQRP